MFKVVHITFCNNEKNAGCYISDEAMYFLSNDNIYHYSEETTMRELARWIASHAEYNSTVLDDDWVIQKKVFGIIDQKLVELNFDYLLEDYVFYNAKDNKLFFEYHFGVSGGWGEQITSTVKLLMPSKEHGHERNPHVHVQKGKYRKNDPESNTVRVLLDDNLTVMDNAEQKAKKLFGKEWPWVIGVIKDNRLKLREMYETMIRGGNPDYLYLNYERKTSRFNNRSFDEEE